VESFEEVKLADGKERTIQHMMATSFWSPDGKPMSAAQFIERLFGDLPELFKDEDALRKLWSWPDTRRRLLALLMEQKTLVARSDPMVTGFNIGNNSGKDAGQTIFHCHFHLIPRRSGDVSDPRGSVRGVIPDNQRY